MQLLGIKFELLSSKIQSLPRDVTKICSVRFSPTVVGSWCFEASNPRPEKYKVKQFRMCQVCAVDYYKVRTSLFTCLG